MLLYYIRHGDPIYNWTRMERIDGRSDIVFTGMY